MSSELVYFLAGVAITVIVAAVVYYRQKRDAEDWNKSFILFLYQVWKNTERQGTQIRQIDDSIATHFDAERDELDGLTQEINEIKSVLIQQYHDSPKSIDANLVRRYKELGDTWSEVAVRTRTFRALTPDGRIFIESVLTLHSSIFPADFPWVGRFRESEVLIRGTFGTAARVIDSTIATSEIRTISPAKIGANLQRLCNTWNGSIEMTKQYDDDNKLIEVAHFHHEFEVIHPFADGNGRVGRIILSDQLMFLLRAPINLAFPREEYFQALNMANAGQIDALAELIKRQLI